jgi:glycerophosphoryl diester phosphodiesterase
MFMSAGLYKSGLLINNKFYAKIMPTKIAAVDIKLVSKYPDIAHRYKKRGIKLYIWTVNTESDLKLCEKLGATAVITDYPARTRKLLGYP